MNADKPKDYVYGWRWLLPVKEGDRLALQEFDAVDGGFWEQTFHGVSLVSNLSAADFVVLEDKKGFFSGRIKKFHQTHPTLSLQEEAGVLRLHHGMRGMAVLADGSASRWWMRYTMDRFPIVKAYALIPPVTPRIVVPLGKASQTREALALHRPGRASARVIAAVLKTFASLGITRPLERKVLVIAQRAGRAPWGAVHAGLNAGSAAVYALYMGTPDDNRKTVALVMDGKRREVIKSGSSDRARAAVKNEAAALRRLADTPLSGSVPGILGFHEDSQQVSLRQEYGQRKAGTRRRIENAVVTFLAGLSEIDGKVKPLAKVLGEPTVISGMDQCKSVGMGYVVMRRLGYLAESGKEVWGHLSHGDFAPWNCAWTKRGLIVFDWEESRSWDLGLSDAFYYRLAPALYIKGRKKKPSRIRRDALLFWERCAQQAGISTADRELYWALWLLQQIGMSSQGLFRELLADLEATWKKDKG